MDLTKIINPVIFQILGTVILLAIIAKFTYKNYLQMLDKREANINNNIKEAQAKNDEASENLNEIKKEKDAMIKEKDQIIDQANQAANQIKDDVIKQARDEASIIIDKANKEAKNSFQELQDEVMSNVYDYVSLVAKDFISNNLDKEKEQLLINEAIKKVNCE